MREFEQRAETIKKLESATEEGKTELVRDMRDRGYSWREIAALIGTTHETARKRYGS